MSHNIFAKAYSDMKGKKYNPDGTLKESTVSAEHMEKNQPNSKETSYGPAIIGQSRIGQCYIG